jgi:hypothetical protein
LFRAIYPRRNIIPARARDVLPRHIADLQTTCVAITVRVDTWRHVDGLIYIDGMYIPECDVSNKSLAWVRFDPCGVGAVDRSDVLENNILDIIGNIGRVAQGADTHCTRFVAGYVLDVYVRAVAFDGDAVLE